MASNQGKKNQGRGRGGRGGGGRGGGKPSLEERKVSVRTALVVFPPEPYVEDIQEEREKHDKSFDRWMPHINLLFPFVYEEDFPWAFEKVQKELESFDAFRLRFSEVENFQHSKENCVVFAKPEVTPKDALHSLQSIVEKCFPNCDDQGKKSESGFTPHLTVGQVKGLQNLRKRKEELEKRWDLPKWKGDEEGEFGFLVDRIYMISRKGDGPFEVKHAIKLKCADRQEQ